MNLKKAAADSAAQALRTVFDQLDNGGTCPADVRAANSAMDVASVFGVTPADYARLLGRS